MLLDAAPIIVMVASFSAAALTVWNAPDVMIGGEMVRVVDEVVVPFAVTSDTTTNCCKCGSVALVTGLTAYTASMVNTSPALMVADASHPSVSRDMVFVSLDEAQVVDCVPFTNGVELSRVPVV